MKKKIILGALLLASFLTQAQSNFETDTMNHYGISVQGHTYVLHMDTIDYHAVAVVYMEDGLDIYLEKGESITIGFQDSFNDDTDNVYRRKVTFYVNDGTVDTYYIDTYNFDYIIDGNYVDLVTISPRTLDNLMTNFDASNGSGYGLFSRLHNVDKIYSNE